jgi:hypothetical protein
MVPPAFAAAVDSPSKREFEDTSVITKVLESSFAGTDNDLGKIEGLIQNYSCR